MKIDFIEDMQSEAIDMLDARTVEPDIYRDEPEQESNHDASGAQLALLLWLKADYCDNISNQSAERIGRRVIAAMWVINPGLFDGTPSLTTLAKRIGMDHTGLSRLVAEVTRELGIKNRAQAHGDGVRK
jgi:hypothetical protein